HSISARVCRCLLNDISMLENNSRSPLALRQRLVLNRSSLRFHASTQCRTPASRAPDHLCPPDFYGAGPGGSARRAATGARSARGCLRARLSRCGASAPSGRIHSPFERLAASAAGRPRCACGFPSADEFGGRVLVRLSLRGAGGRDSLGPAALDSPGG